MTLLKLICDKIQEGFEITFKPAGSGVAHITVSKNSAHFNYRIDIRQAAVNDDQGLIMQAIDMTCRKIDRHFDNGPVIDFTEGLIP